VGNYDRDLQKSVTFCMIWPVLYVTGIFMAAHGASKNPDAARAHALADDGRRSMAAGDYGSACPKLASSLTLDAAPATALDLASCYEKAGKLASAWEAFHRAEAAAAAARQRDRAAVARKKAGALQPRLSRLTIAVPVSTQVAGLAIRCGGDSVQATQWGVAVSRDGGGYDIEAAAPGKSTWTKHVELQPSRQNLVVDVPPLADAPASAAAAQSDAPPEHAPAAAVAETPEDDTDHPGRTQRVLGLVIGGAGIAGIGAGGVIALVAKSQMNTAQGEPNPARHDDSMAATKTGNLATLAVGVGAAATAVGVVVWLTAPTAHVTVGTNGSSVLVGGRF
jgi:hypothetical protein